MKKDLFTGTYRLVSWENRHQSGEVSHPLGPDAKGVISYSGDGFVFVHIMADNRGPHSVGDLFGGDPAELAQSAATHLSYWGTYEIEGDEVVHHVKISSFPNWISSRQRRKYEFIDGDLVLSAGGLTVGDEKVDGRLVWRKLNAPPEL